ncbi:uncharacterized protein BP01DRAFT_383646 [Aspergillus saccharolyticus JOP 1030-1]|uniref:Uncharacterized protein n=1 Tax=Aspergillus saccharolyticus JOP 1030-1 TaxID=1450539 RepID=A0A318ZAI9_9EURO|nr:hypothetical protein BP01DRAFT_383646 [Aspergillus saccharolyticus JOP 1030-1]PYH44461.1 hypothetical protein BP01DRAFT_383646 [Aspergillus saccharolyticus JOP 1030-1]
MNITGDFTFDNVPYNATIPLPPDPEHCIQIETIRLRRANIAGTNCHDAANWAAFAKRLLDHRWEEQRLDEQVRAQLQPDHFLWIRHRGAVVFCDERVRLFVDAGDLVVNAQPVRTYVEAGGMEVVEEEWELGAAFMLAYDGLCALLRGRG